MRTKSSKVTGSVSTRGLAPVIGVCALLGAVAGLHAYGRIEGTLTGYGLSAAQAEHAELLREEKALRLELATRRAASRIESDARLELGMVEPAPDRIFDVSGDPVAVPLTAQARAAR